jgi:hypothetical protein
LPGGRHLPAAKGLVEVKLVRSGDGPIMQSSAPEWLEKLLLRGKCVAHKIGAEDEQCIMFADRLREAALQGRLKTTFSHLPHEVGGGSKNAALRYSLAKALGLITGSYDFVFVWNGGGGWIEFKRSKLSATEHRARRDAGRLTETQKLFGQWCDLLEVKHAVVTSASEGLAILREWGVYAD